MAHEAQRHGVPKSEIARLIESVRRDGESDLYSGKRQSQRFSDALVLHMTTDPKRADRTQSVYLHNISEGGFAFWTRQKIQARTLIYIREPAEDGVRPWVAAQVTHCTFGIRGYLIGASFDPLQQAG